MKLSPRAITWIVRVAGFGVVGFWALLWLLTLWATQDRFGW